MNRSAAAKGMHGAWFHAKAQSTPPTTENPFASLRTRAGSSHRDLAPVGAGCLNLLETTPLSPPACRELQNRSHAAAATVAKGFFLSSRLPASVAPEKGPDSASPGSSAARPRVQSREERRQRPGRGAIRPCPPLAYRVEPCIAGRSRPFRDGSAVSHA